MALRRSSTAICRWVPVWEKLTTFSGLKDCCAGVVDMVSLPQHTTPINRRWYMYGDIAGSLLCPINAISHCRLSCCTVLAAWNPCAWGAGFPARFQQGVLNIVAGDRGTWVLNKQSPNRQIWWSSPIRWAGYFHIFLSRRVATADCVQAAKQSAATTKWKNREAAWC